METKIIFVGSSNMVIVHKRNCHVTSSIARFMVVLITVILAGEVANAATLVTYSGSGFVNHDLTKPDPWGIGDSKPYSFGVTVASDATDSNSLRDCASFTVLSATINIDGISTTVTGNYGITFYDHMTIYPPGGGYMDCDEVLFAISVARNGYTQPLTIVQYLNQSTYTFFHTYEPLPVFESTASIFDGNTIPLSYNYSTSSPAGTQFNVAIPEPSTLALLGIGFISLLVYARRKR